MINIIDKRYCIQLRLNKKALKQTGRGSPSECGGASSGLLSDTQEVALFPLHHHLIGGLNPSEKYESQLG